MNHDTRIQDIKEIMELYNDYDVNSYLKAGWVLLHIGCRTEDSFSRIVYTIGKHYL